MWRLWREAFTSSYRRSTRSSHNCNLKSIKDANEKIFTRLLSLGWDDPKLAIFEGNPSPSVCGQPIASSLLYKGTDDEELPLRSKHRNIGRVNHFHCSETLQCRGFMCKAGLQKEAEEVEGKESSESEEELESEDSSGSDEFEDQDIAGEEDFVGGLVVPAEKEEGKVVAEKELLWNRISRVRVASPQAVMPVINKWRGQGKELNKGFLITYITRLRKRARHKHALQISEWLVTEKPFELDAVDYIFRIDLTARVGHMDLAEKLFKELPSELKNSMAYNTLLMNYAKRGMVKKAEQLFEELKKMGFLTGPFVVNQMIKLYYLKDKKEQVTLLLDEAKSAGIEPDIFTYNMLMDVEGKAGNIEAMEKILDEVKANSKVKLDSKSYGIVASAYITANLLDKAELALKRMETGSYIKTPSMYNALLRMYGQLKNEEEVERIWQVIKKLPRKSNYSLTCLLSAFTSLDSAEGANKAFKDMEQIIRGKQGSTTSLRLLKSLLNIYEKFGLTEKAEELKKDMQGSADTPDAISLHTSVEELIKSDDLEKALDALKLNKKGSRIRPLFDTYFLVLDKYAEKGDVKVAEQIFEACRGARYAKNVKLWNTLLKAYVKADMPAYGIRQRMFAERVYPSSETQKLLDDMKQQALKR
ncbi:hypothetical protein O6H91_02G109200 [Diphasiastrum complanatum]|uniref:Uncharacterized protein n=2 Tax=Diphasiastrum complanatum TaxID=34168 RepID=A0ACC2EJM4_DIPCM|nr:hypothetical protein O6H91_02G109200 [Diphasiastrum complanatum]KAJ7566574.1 hypothetical protein O6H91_02G109200 [Diphasiastrum complanatum]